MSGPMSTQSPNAGQRTRQRPRDLRAPARNRPYGPNCRPHRHATLDRPTRRALEPRCPGPEGERRRRNGAFRRGHEPAGDEIASGTPRPTNP
jgi:hypothetical protein